MDEATAREKLELVLMELASDKYSDESYNSKEYIDNRLAENDMSVENENIVIVDDWKFEIDRNTLQIVDSYGKGTENQEIEIEASVAYNTTYSQATITYTISYNGDLKTIVANGKKIDIPEKQEEKYIVQINVNENGTYKIHVIDSNDKYKIGTGEVDKIVSPSKIRTAEELIEFRERVNNGESFEGKEIKLANDIDLKGSEENKWTPIGNTTNKFKGTFNGDNKTISGLYVNTGANYQGLFGYVENGTIENLNIQGTSGASGKDNVGLLAGYCSGGKIDNVHTIEGSSVKGGVYVGGLIGYSNSQISNVSNSAIVTGSNNCVGGIVGRLEGEKAKISNAANLAKVTGSLGYAGGIAGSLRSSATIETSYNKGNIRGNGNDGTGYTSVGGIAGESQGTMIYCYNRGEIYGAKGQVAGIGGNSYGHGGTPIHHCYNTGAITGGGRAIGSILGEGYACTISYCYWTSTNGGIGYRGSISNCGNITGEILTTYANILGSPFTDDKNKINDGYPILSWQQNQN